MIQSKLDLGAIPQLLGKPRTYARFLGAELRFAYRGQLLTAMHNGYGLTRNGNPVPGADKILSGIPLPKGNTPDELTQAAITRRSSPGVRRAGVQAADQSAGSCPNRARAHRSCPRSPRFFPATGRCCWRG